jgi:hypothetical protein
MVMGGYSARDKHTVKKALAKPLSLSPGAAARGCDARPSRLAPNPSLPGFGMPGTWTPPRSQPWLGARADVCVASRPHTPPSATSTGSIQGGSTGRAAQCTEPRHRTQTAPRRTGAGAGRDAPVHMQRTCSDGAGECGAVVPSTRASGSGARRAIRMRSSRFLGNGSFR